MTEEHKAKIEIKIDKDEGRLGRPGHTGYAHYLVLDLSEDEPSVYLWYGTGTLGTPMHLWHNVGWSFGLPLNVDAGAVVETLESDEAQALLAEVCAQFEGTEWNGSNHVGVWDKSDKAEARRRDISHELESLFENLSTYWDAGDWLFQAGSAETLLEVATLMHTGKTLEEIGDMWATDAIRSASVLVDEDEIVEAIKSQVKDEPSAVEGPADGVSKLLKACGVECGCSSCECGKDGELFDEAGVYVCSSCITYIDIEGEVVCGTRTDGFTKCHDCERSINWGRIETGHSPGQMNHRHGSCGCEGRRWWNGEDGGNWERYEVR